MNSNSIANGDHSTLGCGWFDSHLTGCASVRYTAGTASQGAGGFDSPERRRSSRADSFDSGFFHARNGFDTAQHGYLFGGPCGEGESPAGPTSGLSTLHGLPPSFDSAGDRFTTCHRGATMADTATQGTFVAASELSASTPDLHVVDGHVITTSQQVAQHFGKGHNLVLRAIRNLECSDKFRLSN